MDDRERGWTQRNYGGGNGRKRKESSFSDDSDGSPGQPARVAGFDSGSDSDPKKWTKNPLVVRRVKRSDKAKQLEKRLSATENGVTAKNRSSIGCHGNEEGSSGAGSLGGGNSSGSANKGSNKYQKLEEMRRRRINLCVTSDEETAPSYSKARSRQRVIQDRPASTYQVSASHQKDSVQWEDGGDHRHPVTLISSAPGGRLFTANALEMTPNHQSALSRPNLVPRTIDISQVPSVAPQSYVLTTDSSKDILTPAYAPDPSFPRVTAKTPSSLSHTDPKQQYWINQKTSGRNSTVPVMSGGFHDVNVYKLTTQADPVVSPATISVARNTSQPQPASQSLTLSQARWSPTRKQEQQNRAVCIPPSKSQPHNELETRLKKPQNGRQPKIDRVHPASFCHGDDSLDELIESNIQYLDSEIDKSKARTSNTNVLRFSSLSDPRKRFSASPLQRQPSIQVEASTSIEFRVSLPQEICQAENHLAAPVLQIAASNSNSELEGQMISQPDVVPRRYIHDRLSKSPRPNSEYYNNDDVLRSARVLNSQVVVQSHHDNAVQSDVRGNSSLVTLRPDTGSSLQAPQMDKGMFSDVEYDIEVSERVKKWETFMKDKDGKFSGERNKLTTIPENVKDDTGDVGKSVVLDKKWGLGSSYSTEQTDITSNRSRPFISDTLTQRFDNGIAQPMFSQTNAQKFFHTVQSPRVSLRTQSVNTIFHSPVSLTYEKPVVGAREQMVANRQPCYQTTGGPVQATSQSAAVQATRKQVPPSSTISSAMSSFSQIEAQDSKRRGLRYRQELAEISNVKTDSVSNLRRRFDTDSATMTSEDDQISVSKASAKLSRPSQKSPQHKETMDWSQVLPGYQTMIKDSDVWSPNLESTQGVPVSIERVTARTLQTIPFSEDPFWKELEQMTSFDPSSLPGYLNANKISEKATTGEPVRSQHQVELSTPHSLTLPNQPRTNVISVKERMQRSKSLYTPNITPLSINVNDREPSSAAIALDEVLNDINKSSMERKQLSPKKRTLETNNASTNQEISAVSGYLKPKLGNINLSSTSEVGKLCFGKPGINSFPFRSVETANVAESGTMVAQSKQPLQFYQNQRQQQQPPQTQNRQSLTLPNSANSYHLDPNLLKEKLLSTGLVVETDTEEPVSIKQYQSSFHGPSALHFVPHSTAVPSFTTTHSETFGGVGGAQPTVTTLSQISNPAVTAPTADSKSSAPPWSTKRTGTSALDDIQKALAPFRSTSYQPNPETLYGTSKLQSFSNANFDTSRGPHTSATSWYYQPQIKNAELATDKQNSGASSSSRLQEVNKSMDDLKNLARGVEERINNIKQKLLKADEGSLDSVLCSLRKVTPEIQSQDEKSQTLEDYYTAKKSKLFDALAELDRISKNLDLTGGDLENKRDNETSELFTSNKSNFFILGKQPKSVHLRPMQTRISSVFIPGLDKKRTDVGEGKESEFDIISRSFQAIVDEVNQTTDMLSRAAERQKQGQTAPETHKQTFKTTVKPGSSENAVTSLSEHLVSPATDSKSSATAEHKTQEVSRIKSKDSLEKSESNTNTISEYLPSQESKAVAATESADGDNVANLTVSVKSSLSSQQQPQVGSGRDNKIPQDDKTSRTECAQNVSSSPIISRKISGGQDSDTGLLQDPAGKITETQTTQSHVSVKQQNPKLEDKSESKCRDLGDTQKTSVAGMTASATSSLPSKDKCDKIPITLRLTTSKSLLADNIISSSSSGLSHLSSSSSTASIKLTPPISDSSQPKTLTAGSKLDDSESTSSSELKTKRRLGIGVAMILDQFSSGEDGLDSSKRHVSTRGTLDLTRSGRTEDIKDDKKSTQTHVTDPSEDKIGSQQQMKSPVRSLARKISTEGKSALGSPKERKVTDTEAKVIRSRTSSPQPPSPVSKPPLSPAKRQTSDTDTHNINDGIRQSSTGRAGSPIRFASKIPRPVASTARTDGQVSSKVKDSPVQRPLWVQLKTVKFPDSKTRAGSSFKARPHSFHELISCFEKGPGKLQSSDKFRKCASADEVSTETLVDEVFDESVHATKDGTKTQECCSKNTVA